LLASRLAPIDRAGSHPYKGKKQKRRERGEAMDWDKLRVFQAAADAGSFTHAGEALGLSQSAISRQVSALEQDLGTPLFHRHARGLILTEQGELLLGTVQDVVLKLEAVRSRLIDSREKPHGELRVTTTLGLGSNWLAPRLGEFLELYPEIKLQLLLTDDDLDLGMREADVALRLREPSQPDLIRRRLFTVHFHAYASTEYLKRYGQPRSIGDLDAHRLLAFVTPTSSHILYNLNSLLTVGRDARNPRTPHIAGNNLGAITRAVEQGVGIAVLPDYCVTPDSGVVRLLPQADMPEMECYLVYAEEMKNVARVQAFRDFLVAKAQRWRY
jgi:DNA-binding transcriptional LysR family regulator